MLKSLFQSTADPGSGDFIREELLELTGRLAPELRTSVASYLRSAPLILAWMESTTDLIGGKFKVPGGSAIASDGTYYWRLDTANYVETYGIGIPATFLRHAERLRWIAPVLDDFAVLELDDELSRLSGPTSTPGLEVFYPQE